ncbi:hypothetical protein PPTG_24676 [Phytophthora nicotianae INRA-310]|uniref:Uncharacterized protein n=1 Tax=Phytophthora nicotianae (strain INRA-310) TaxID=761204 RepID=W2PDH8_PHYN3|nr:hypothetical protein PPTG_24676 [Phytophthora nicotianae INRA-310]ETM98258.1 hypothetical protein PPTG_24676 [Phytophthora nicotianae INRA-310]
MTRTPFSSLALPPDLKMATVMIQAPQVSNVLDQYPVRMDDKFLQVRPVTCKVADETSDTISIDHTFVIPASLLKKASAAIILKREEMHAAKVEMPWGLLVSFGSGNLVLHRMENFYTLKAKARGYIKDVKWLNQDWRLVQAHPVDLFP